MTPPTTPLNTAPPAAVPGPSAGGWRVALLMALAYAAAGELALVLAIPPGYASPIYPATGLALAGVLVYGGAALPGVLLGAYLVNLHTGTAQSLSVISLLVLPLTSAIGATLQAALGAALVRWRLQGRLSLAGPRDVATLFVLGALVACLLNASLSIPALAAAGLLQPGEIAFTWWTWWGGDALGVLIGTPLALTLIGRPRADWVPRRLSVGLPLLATTVLLALATLLVARWDLERSQSVFERDASAAAAGLDAELRQALFALQAVHGLVMGSDEVTPVDLQRASRPWLNLPIQPQAIGVSQRVARSDLARFEAEVSRSSGRDYRVVDRSLNGLASPAAADDDVVAIRLIEPMARNIGALGINSMSVPAAREAIQRAAASDAVAATAGFLLAQERGEQTGVVLYRALYSGEPAAENRRQAFSGVVFVALRLQQSAEAGLRDAPGYLHWCLLDSRGDAVRRHLAGPDGCEDARPWPLQTESVIALGGQRWLLRIGAGNEAVPDAGNGNAWLFSTVGLLSTAMLAALLLTVTGRTRRIEVAVDERTADLQREAAERRRTESALRVSEQRFRNIFDHAPIGIVYADLQGQLRDANPRMQELIGYDAPALSRRSIAALTHPDDRAEVAQALGRLLRDELPEVQQNARLQHADGQLVRVRMNWSVLRDAEAQPRWLVAVVEDITEQLRRQEAEQGRLLAESANRAKSEFLSRMSHELRTPLNAMLGFAQLLDLDRSPQLPPHQRGWVAQILQAGWHLLDMINDTLDLSRIESGMLKLTTAPVALAPMVGQCVAMLGPAAARRAVQLQVRLADDAGWALGDATRLKQVLTNLLSNAVKYNVQGGSVLLSSRRLDAQTLELRVRDTGLGLDAAQMANLFQPFNRLGREQGDTEGTGIGLVISRRLAELMGGTLHAESAPDQGATFVLRLPLAGDAAPGPRPADEGADDGPAYHHRRVHYVEDNETNVEVMRGILAQRPQVTLEVSLLGLDGLAAIRRQRPDLILLDMHLPDVDGLELLRQLQNDPICADIPVVVVSADATPARMQEALAAGARRYMTKPVNLGDFLAMLDELLESMDTRFG